MWWLVRPQEPLPGATSSATGRGTGTAPGSLRLLQVRPRLILFGAVPVLGQRRLAQQRTLGRACDLPVLQDGDQRAPCRWEIHGLEQAHVTLLIDHSFDRSNHCLSLCPQCIPPEPLFPTRLLRAAPP